jgi:hypothetical protein
MNGTSMATHRIIRTGSVALLTLAVLAAPLAAEAWQRSVSRTNGKGMTSGRTITGAGTTGGYTRNSTYTGPQGNSATRSAQGQWDPATKTWTKDVSATGPSGQTATRSTTATRTEDGYTSSGTVTGPDGNSATRSAQGQWDPETNTWTKSVTVTGPGQ